MYDPASRLLTILHLLHIHDVLSAGVLAAKVNVSTRTVRRYITMLRDMGVSVETNMGINGGYSLAQRSRMPPSIFSKEELQILLLALSRLDPTSVDDATLQAIGKKIGLLLDAAP